MYVYILKCSDDSFYVGITNDLEMRFEQHTQGIVRSCYTFLEDKLKSCLMSYLMITYLRLLFEKKLKGWSKKKKQALIDSNWDKLKVLSVCRNDSHSRNA